jgi:LysM repeat protein
MICRVSGDFVKITQVNDFNLMRLPLKLILSCGSMVLLGACANQDPLAQNDPFGTGPFDANGNYREEWADNPAKWRRPGSRQKPVDDLPVIAANERPPANATPLAPARPTTTNTATTTVRTAPKPVAAKPKPVAVKPKPKPKPQPSYVRYTVKKGDTLGAIASRNGSTVSGIQRASGISGTLIRPGQVLKVPKTTRR